MKLRSWPALGLALVMVAVACSPTASNPGAPGSPAAATASAPAALTTIRYVQPSGSMAYLPALVAVAMDLFKAEGLKVEVGPNTPQGTQALLGGEVDIAALSTPQALSAINAGRPIKLIGVLTPTSSNDLALSNAAIARLKAQGVTKDSSMQQRLAALRGMTITLPAEGSSSNLTFRQLLREAGLNPDRDLTLIAQSDAAAHVATTREGRADGYVFSPPVTTIATTDGFGDRWVAFWEAPSMAGLYIIELGATEAYLKANPKAAAGFLRAIHKAFELIRSDPNAVRAPLKERWFKDLNQKTFDLAFEQMVPVFADGIVPVPSNVRKVIALTDEQVPEKLNLTMEQVFDVSYLKLAGIIQ